MTHIKVITGGGYKGVYHRDSSNIWQILSRSMASDVSTLTGLRRALKHEPEPRIVANHLSSWDHRASWQIDMKLNGRLCLDDH